MSSGSVLSYLSFLARVMFQIQLLRHINTHIQSLDHFEEWWRPQLSREGYDGSFYARTGGIAGEGVAIFFRRKLFQVSVDADTIHLLFIFFCICIVLFVYFFVCLFIVFQLMRTRYVDMNDADKSIMSGKVRFNALAQHYC